MGQFLHVVVTGKMQSKNYEPVTHYATLSPLACRPQTIPHGTSWTNENHWIIWSSVLPDPLVFSAGTTYEYVRYCCTRRSFREQWPILATVALPVFMTLTQLYTYTFAAYAYSMGRWRRSPLLPKSCGSDAPNRPHKNLGTKIGYDHFVNSDPITQLAYGRG